MGSERMMTEHFALIALLQHTKQPWNQIRVQLEDFLPSELLREDLKAGLLDTELDRALAEATSQIEGWRRDGILVSTPYVSTYPSQLRTVHDYPPVLFSRGSAHADDDQSIAVVGTRNPSEGALRFIAATVPLLVSDGHTVVSGLARGVDTAAMKASLSAGGRTVGIIGTGIRRAYPAENRALQERIATEHLLLSQFWPDAPGSVKTFPMRNHVMSAFSAMTLIVEASERSGTRIQARAATQHGRPVIITRAVYTQTDWGKALVSRGFDVTVVGSPDETIAAVRAIRERIRTRDTEEVVPIGA